MAINERKKDFSKSEGQGFVPRSYEYAFNNFFYKAKQMRIYR